MRYKFKFWVITFILSSIFWLGTAKLVGATSEIFEAHQRHILSRLSFGTTASQLEEVKNSGIEAYIQTQLNPQKVVESPKVDKYLSQLDLIHREPIKLQIKEAASRKKLKHSNLSIEQQTKLRQKINQAVTQAKDEAIDAHLIRAIYSNRQLQEVMVDFWFNHFNVSADNGVGSIKLWVNDYTNNIRTLALGNFGDLLAMTARHPAMMLYLNNNSNTAPNSPVGLKNSKGLNENYARELMELHTLGVNGGYTQEDIISLARIFTGWGVDRTGKRGEGQGFFFYQQRHDPRGKNVFRS